MSEALRQERCPACGKPNACGMNEQGECWCATEFPPRMPLAASAAAACYCRDCLRAMMESLPPGERERGAT